MNRCQHNLAVGACTLCLAAHELLMATRAHRPPQQLPSVFAAEVQKFNENHSHTDEGRQPTNWLKDASSAVTNRDGFLEDDGHAVMSMNTLIAARAEQSRVHFIQPSGDEEYCPKVENGVERISSSSSRIPLYRIDPYVENLRSPSSR